MLVIIYVRFEIVILLRRFLDGNLIILQLYFVFICKSKVLGLGLQIIYVIEINSIAPAVANNGLHK